MWLGAIRAMDMVRGGESVEPTFLHLLPECIGIIIAKTLRSKSEFVRGYRPFCEVANVGPRKNGRLSTWGGDEEERIRCDSEDR